MRLLKHMAAGTIALVVGLGVSAAMSASADVVVVVSAKSAVRSLSSGEIADLFLGRRTRFPAGQPAVPVDQREGTAVRDEFYTRFTGKSASQLKAHWSKIIFTGRGKPPQAVSNDSELKKLITANPAVIGYVDAKVVDSTLRVVTLTGQ